MPAGQNHSNFALNTRLSAPRYDTWCKIQVSKCSQPFSGFPLKAGLKVGFKVHGKSKSHLSANPKWLDWELPPVVKQSGPEVSIGF